MKVYMGLKAARAYGKVSGKAEESSQTVHVWLMLHVWVCGGIYTQLRGHFMEG